MPTAAAVANAVAHAVGVRVRALPISPDLIQRGFRLTSRGVPTAPLWQRPHRWWAATARWLYPRGLRAVLHKWGTRLAKPAVPVPPIDAVVRVADSTAAVAALAAQPGSVAIGGATDVLVLREQGLAPAATLIDLASCSDLTSVDTDEDGDLVIGAAVTLANLGRHLESSARSGEQALRATIDSIASAQIREAATIAGNLCQANRCWFYRSGFTCYKRGGSTCPCYAVSGDHRYFHAILDAGRCQAVTPSDLATTLTALDAVATTKSQRFGQREISMAELYTGPGETVLHDDEIIESLTIPAKALDRTTYFEKLALYEGGFAVVSACVSAAREDETLSDCRIVLGGIANTPFRAHAAERRLVQTAPATDNTILAASQIWAREAHPLIGNTWKVDAACGVLRRTLVKLVTP